MAPESVCNKARSMMTCHPEAGIIIGDPYFLNGKWKAMAFCSRCNNSRTVILTDEEYKIMSEDLPWHFVQGE